MDKYLFTLESRTEGHPDKASDKISDSIIEAIIKQHPNDCVMVDTCGAVKYPNREIVKAVRKLFDFCPTAIIKKLDLRKPIYKEPHEHMGREDLNVSWEKTDMSDILTEYFKNR